MSHMYTVSQPLIVDDDLVARLRDVGWCGWETQQEAADEIERLRNRVIDLNNLLKEAHGMTMPDNQGEPQP